MVCPIPNLSNGLCVLITLGFTPESSSAYGSSHVIDAGLVASGVIADKSRGQSKTSGGVVSSNGMIGITGPTVNK